MNLKRRLQIGLAAGAGAAIAGYGAYSGIVWMRYGRRELASQSPLRRFVPFPEIAERHEAIVPAPIDRVWNAAISISMSDSPLVRLIFKTRQLFMRADEAPQPRRSLIDEVERLGWGRLYEAAGSEIVFGAVCKPWEGNVHFRAIPDEDFAAFAEKEHVKIAWSIAVKPHEKGTLFSTETLASATDDQARRRFRNYWSLVSPGVKLIRLEMLRLVKRASAKRSATRSRRERRYDPRAT